MKNRRVVYVCLFIWVVFTMGLVNAAEQKTKTDEKGMPDPAAAYAVKLGYKYEIREGEGGVVIFPDGTECGTWSFFRGRDGQKWSYCEQHGGKIENRTEDMGSYNAEYAVCVFPDGTECGETDYMDGTCGPGVYKKWSLDEEKRIKVDDPSLHEKD